MQVSGISAELVTLLKEKTEELSQGREVACIAYYNKDGIVDEYSDLVSGGIGGIPLRQLLNTAGDISGKSLISGIEQLPDNALMISTKPGQTGLITDVSGIDLFNLIMVSVGVKMGETAGISAIYPEGKLFDLSTESEMIELQRLSAKNIEEEKSIIEASIKLNLEFLNISTELPVVNVPAKKRNGRGNRVKKDVNRNLRVNGLDKELAQELVAESVKVGQGREVAVIGEIDKEGIIRKAGKVVYGGIGYVPARVLASSYCDISGKSLYEVYKDIIPANGVIVHTHPGGTGVMHMGDASAGPITWGRPIVAIGHDKNGRIKGATVIMPDEKCMSLADEYEKLGQQFFTANTKEEEADIRNRRFGIAQEYTNLSLEIELV
ncbi:MAG TPA: peptidase S7 [Clostridia bacterium]|nr:peptidase S7 [Clostridia bacterium]